MRSNCDFNISLYSSVQQHALNVDFTSHTFTDVNLQYATHSDGISASVSSPATGLLGLQFSRAVPSQMSAKVYGRYLVSIVSKIILIQWTQRKYKEERHWIKWLGREIELGRMCNMLGYLTIDMEM